MNIKKHLSYIILCLLAITARAQQGTVQGIVYRNNTSTRIAQVVVTNLRTNATMMSDELGIFTINAKPGDTLLFDKSEFADLRHIVGTEKEMVVYMRLMTSTELEEVKIKATTKQQELSEVMRDYRGQGTFFNGSPPALAFLMSPLTGLYELFGKTPGRAKRFAKFSKAELEQNEINRRYNVPFVKRTLNVSDEEAGKFINYYMPSYEDIRVWNDYELIKRVKRQYEYFKINKDPLRTNPFQVKPADTARRN
ncbi:hypothetical protein LJ707_16910 [Mucilaginibacter sp. UR6-1]|uniref:hypothetical protein n=1 Tax=Mucilaginibacter sp. UR6-1 TaxID=1435643 RepID=UPI001E644C8B|nr:hypothetical protein [Mucilaginibacter sp. UR6-1]MCC8410625.1 hypothetical protein [Mucilaginibacter sp. UR6-1]